VLDKDFNTANLNIFKELKGQIRTGAHQKENTSNEITIIFKNRNFGVKMYNNSCLELTEERISNFVQFYFIWEVWFWFCCCFLQY
jgi:hypothetical protein